jgi:DNA mismatch endonuclease (patch repair protein)
VRKQRLPDFSTTDVQRRRLMAGVRQARTSAENRVAAILRTLGARHRRNVRSLAGSPDFANKSEAWSIFVNGCFWHHHRRCARATIPKTNTAFWRDKFAANKARDQMKIKALRSLGFRVVVVWECELTHPTRVAARLSQMLEAGRIDVG